MLECTGNLFVRRSSRSQQNEWMKRQWNAHRVTVIGDIGTRCKENKDTVQNSLVRLVEAGRVLLNLSLWYTLIQWLHIQYSWCIHVLKSWWPFYSKVKPCWASEATPIQVITESDLHCRSTLVKGKMRNMILDDWMIQYYVCVCKPTTLWFTDHFQHSLALHISQWMPISIPYNLQTTLLLRRTIADYSSPTLVLQMLGEDFSQYAAQATPFAPWIWAIKAFERLPGT